MDEMNIVSKFMTGVISKLATAALRKKLGCDADIRLNNVKVTVTDGKLHLHLDADAELEKEELLKLVGLD